MNEENHIIKFEYSSILLKKLVVKSDIYINEYKLFKYIIFGSSINIYYNNLDVCNLDININRDYIFNLSNMLYKIHTPHYYSKIHQNKGLI